MPPADDFMAHPRTFMRANIVMMSGTNANVPKGTHDFTLAPGTGLTARNMLLPGQPEMPVYVLKPHTGEGLRGCTFAVGSRTADRGVAVFHINMSNSNGSGGGGASGLAQQRKLQRNIGKSLAKNGALIEPDDYMDPQKAQVVIPPGAKIATVTFGRRSQREGWKFYTHQWYTVEGDRFRLNFIGTQRAI